MQRILIVGAGVAGRSLARNLKKHGYKVVGFVDDADIKSNAGFKKLGNLSDVNMLISKEKITDIYFSIPSASPEKVRKFINSVESKKVHLLIVPRSFRIISDEEVSINDLRDVDILHLIGREPVKQDLFLAKKEIEGKKILITGAAGSIGSELVQQVLLLKPKEIICVDFWESGIFYLQHEVGNKRSVTYYIANIRDKKRLEQIFSKHKPDFVFHAAAYKHVPLMQENSLEAVNNNVLGSLNLIDTAIKHKVKCFVNVSTDKAVNPVNVMGTTKRVVEILLQNRSRKQSNTKISSVRFGNVLESNGSVVQLFKRQIEKGGPITLTHKEITRFFMTKEEAAQLIIQAAILSNNGEIFVLDMGDPIKVRELAELMVRLAKKDIEIKTIGLRSGEKMYEELYFDKEHVKKTRHNQIFVVNGEDITRSKDIETKINQLLKKTSVYDLGNEEVIDKLRKLGFKIKK
ncbi:polysaccharide biosynthesis protein [Candidatus Dojkabacteria bacterium]|nr:polysaccharide biosynthesis protein [Candidatus Dojkabacteria bacterium]